MAVAVELAVEAATRVQEMLAEDTDVAVLVFDADVKRTFVRSEGASIRWEAECAMDAAGATRAALAVPVDEGDGAFLHVIAVDLDWGFDIYRVRYARHDQVILFDNLEVARAPMRLPEEAPGYTLIQAMRAFGEDDGR